MLIAYADCYHQPTRTHLMVLASIVVPCVLTVDHKVDRHCPIGDIEGRLPPHLSVLTLSTRGGVGGNVELGVGC
jgi:hypothetical protein